MVDPDPMNVLSNDSGSEDVLGRLDRLKDEVEVLRSRIEQIRPEAAEPRVQPDRHRMEAPYSPAPATVEGEDGIGNADR
jgi:hypothetical protein